MTEYVVGVDASDRALAALRWAIEHADPDGDRIVAVHAWSFPTLLGPEAASIDPAIFEREAETVLGQVLETTAAGPIAVEGEIIRGHPGRGLVERAGTDGLLVVGARGHEGVAGLLLGSTSTYVVHHAECPVVVVPTER
ncbi:MAG: universal stress protein [Actinomycetota bacterium]